MRVRSYSAWFGVGLGVLSIAGCNNEIADASRKPAAEPSRMEEAAPVMVETEAERALELGRPVTLRLAPTDELLETIRSLEPGQAASSFLRLTLQDLETPAAELVVRVFVNTPGASQASPTENPNYLGEVGFFPTTASNPSTETVSDSSFLLDIGSLLASLPPEGRLVEGRFVDVTLVAVPLRDTPRAEALGGARVPFRGVRLSKHEPPSSLRE
jgi:hypothetical protein